jgi:mRNA interferase MazF
VSRDYVPERGDVVWLTFTPQAGHEQAGRRPAAILSPAAYNGKVGLALLCPITSQVKGYPFEVMLPAGLAVSGVILADQVKSLDWRVREAEYVATLPGPVVKQVLERLAALLE